MNLLAPEVNGFQFSKTFSITDELPVLIGRGGF